MAENEKTQDDMLPHIVDSLRAMLRLNNLEPLPEDVVCEYWKLNGLFSRAGGMTLIGHPLAMMLYQMGYADGISVKKEPKSIREQWKKGEVGVNTPVIVRWKNKDRDGVLKNLADGGYTVQLDGEDGERTVKEDAVKLAELAAA